MPRSLRVALIQMTSSDAADENVAIVERLAREAAACGAQLIATPEVTTLIESRRERLLAKLHDEAADPALAAYRALARDLKAWLLIGSMAVRAEVPGKAANRSFLITPDGGIAARYDKIHMFDVSIGEGESYRESRTYEAGAAAQIVDAAGLRLGLTICYDMRFPALYRQLCAAGAEVIAVPSAFTRPTGAAHWETLLRARAIETGAFILAPAQSGAHRLDGGASVSRRTWGRSLIVDPWGRVLANGGEGPGVILADLDLAAVAAARARIPTLAQDRRFRVVRAEKVGAENAAAFFERRARGGDAAEAVALLRRAPDAAPTPSDKVE